VPCWCRHLRDAGMLDGRSRFHGAALRWPRSDRWWQAPSTRLGLAPDSPAVPWFRFDATRLAAEPSLRAELQDGRRRWVGDRAGRGARGGTADGRPGSVPCRGCAGAGTHAARRAAPSSTPCRVALTGESEGRSSTWPCRPSSAGPSCPLGRALHPLPAARERVAPSCARWGGRRWRRRDDRLRHQRGPRGAVCRARRAACRSVRGRTLGCRVSWTRRRGRGVQVARVDASVLKPRHGAACTRAWWPRVGAREPWSPRSWWPGGGDPG